MATKRGMGCVYKRGNIYWIKYSHRRKAHLESSHSDKEADAKRLLKKRLGEMEGGGFIGPSADKVTLRELLEGLVNDYQVNARRSTEKAKRSKRHLLGFFGEAKAMEIRTDHIKLYVAHRQAEDISNAEINRELAALKRAYNLGIEAENIVRKPHIPMLKENNIRRGFFEHGDFISVRKALPDYLKPVITFGFITGWRKSEILSLRWNQVDLQGQTIRIDPGITKGGEGRTIFLDGELRETIQIQAEARRLDCPYVFHRSGRPIKDFRGSWESALKATGLKGMLFHDLRRSAVRNMIRAGVPQSVAKRISGHKTDEVFHRYDIVSDEDLREASRKVEAHNRERTVTATVTVVPFKGKEAVASKS